MVLLSQQHICALIPTYNNAGTIIEVIRRVHQQMRDIIVVADGCTDNTLELLSTLDFPITVVSYARNKGKGAALAAGFRKALEMGFDYAVTIDADGQHYPEDIPLLLRAHDVHPDALIIGSRQFTDKNMSG
ncbi:MAG: glycosyltransferase family 2 protein, partial [Paludibacteraceae bacterium]|nr:glycosyltransferase family 2 protein [Paludibacteraceae bacterium]